MAGEKTQFRIDELVINGAPQAFEDGSASIAGAARWENGVVTTSGGDDFETRKRVPCTVTFKLQFGANEQVTDFATLRDAQVVCRDMVTGKRALMPRCGFGSMGNLGEGSVAVVLNVLSQIQWI